MLIFMRYDLWYNLLYHQVKGKSGWLLPMHGFMKKTKHGRFREYPRSRRQCTECLMMFLL
ncbi:MAG: hypothetical protein IPG02_09075 [Ignavibacteria bacterium]|nr:hypothetical protein [Ignavibacteria bacterium]